MVRALGAHSQFRLVARTRQVTEYSCGACALQAVMSYWGKNVDESELMKVLRTTSEEGTYPENIVRGAQALGFDAEARDHLSLEEVEQFTAEGAPMIALVQAWRSEKGDPDSAAEEWDNGHYVVVLGVDKDYVYFEDPYVRMSKGFVPRETFVDHWHQVMGGDLSKNPKLMQLGIFVRGKNAIPCPAAANRSLAELDFARFGSLNLMVTRFPRAIPPYDFLNELKDIWEKGQTRPDAFIYLRKDKLGRISGLEGSSLQKDDDITAINALISTITSRSLGVPELASSKAEAAVVAAAAGDFGLTANDMQGLAQKLQPNESAIVVLFENVWERRFREAAEARGGEVLNQWLISSQALAEPARRLARGDGGPRIMR
jgi:predicted double-glycine peptidase